MIRIVAYTMYLALKALKTGASLNESTLQEIDWMARDIKNEHSEANQSKLSSVKDDLQEAPPLDPWEEIEVEFSSSGELLRVISQPLITLVDERSSAIQEMLQNAIKDYPIEIENVTALFRNWMANGSIVRVIGAGRALLAASLPANRLQHGGAAVSLLGDKAPLPNSRLGGGMIAASASGKTEAVLVELRRAKQINRIREFKKDKPIIVVGISKDHDEAREFRSLCTPGYYLGFRIDPPHIDQIQLRGLGDIEEFAISELLDALVVRAGIQLGLNFRTGHEDFGPTGPWHQHRADH